MKLNQDHKTVLQYAFEILETCGDDTFLDIKHDTKLNKAYNELVQASKHIYKKTPKVPKIPPGAIKFGKLTSKDVLL